MSDHWDLYCVTCKQQGNVAHWNRGDAALHILTKHLAAVAALKPLVDELRETKRAVNIELRFEYGPDWQSDLIAFAVAHAGHDVRAVSEYGYCFACDQADYAESDRANTWISTNRNACTHAGKRS